ncbi:MAG: Uma2 family endonuclease [Gemmatimonadaceae bacterium]|nr:Uma2 family endonuclease [Gemmatimonadaceae bacterium]
MPHVVSPEDDRIWTVEELAALPDDGPRYELLHGELLLMPSPTSPHQRVAFELAYLLGTWCRAVGGWDVRAPASVPIGRTTQLEPDVALYAVKRHAAQDWAQLPVPALVIEVLSPSNRRIDRHRKRPAYLAHGVGEVWTVDVDARFIERWTAASDFPLLERQSFSWAPVAGVTPLEVAFEECFGPPPAPDTDDRRA